MEIGRIRSVLKPLISQLRLMRFLPVTTSLLASWSIKTWCLLTYANISYTSRLILIALNPNISLRKLIQLTQDMSMLKRCPVSREKPSVLKWEVALPPSAAGLQTKTKRPWQLSLSLELLTQHKGRPSHLENQLTATRPPSNLTSSWSWVRMDPSLLKGWICWIKIKFTSAPVLESWTFKRHTTWRLWANHQLTKRRFPLLNPK